jgi:hypothetical protein
MFNILMPVYKGGAFFIAALQSIIKNCPASVKIFISFNGSSDGDYLEFNRIRSSVKNKNEIIINRTKSDLSSIQHAKAIDIWLRDHFRNDDQIMFLCHDDKIIEKISTESASKIEMQGDGICFPEWHLYDESGKFLETKSVSEINLNQSIESFIFETFKAGDIYTNLSGISCSYKTYKKFIKWLKYKKSGARMEFMLATARNVHKITCDTSIKIQIHKSNQSDGALINLKNYYYDELVFMIWLIFNFRILKYSNLKFSFLRIFDLYKMYKSQN